MYKILPLNFSFTSLENDSIFKKNVNLSNNLLEGPWEDVDIDIWIMYVSCLASLTQICEISVLLHEAKPSNQFLLKEKHVNHDLVLKFNKNKKGYFC